MMLEAPLPTNHSLWKVLNYVVEREIHKRSLAMLMQRIRAILVWSNTRTFEGYSGVTAGVVGLWFLHPTTSLEGFRSWRYLASLPGSGEGTLGLLFVLTGLLSFVGVIENWFFFRRWGQFILGLLFFAVTASAFVGGNASPAVVVYCCLALGCMLTSIRLAVLRE